MNQSYASSDVSTILLLKIWSGQLRELSDIVQFSAGLKKICRLSGVQIDSSTKNILRGLGVSVNNYILSNCCEVRSTHVDHCAQNVKISTTEVEIYCFSWSDSPVSSADFADLEANNPAEAGLALGYPPCCLITGNDFSAEYKFRIQKYFAQPLYWSKFTNYLSGLVGRTSMVGEMLPCSPDCASCSKYGKLTIEACNKLSLPGLSELFHSDSVKPISSSLLTGLLPFSLKKEVCFY